MFGKSSNKKSVTQSPCIEIYHDVFHTDQIAVGLLSVVAVVHIAITVVLGVLIAVVCYYGKRNKAGQSEHESITCKLVINAFKFTYYITMHSCINCLYFKNSALLLAIVLNSMVLYNFHTRSFNTQHFTMSCHI